MSAPDSDDDDEAPDDDEPVRYVDEWLRCPDYDAIKALSIELNRPAKTLIALSPEADPFYVMPSRHASAHWFAEIWVGLGWESVAENSPDGVHLRRLHYRLVSEPPASRPFKDVGRAYENTYLDWQEFAIASRDARHLELVDEALFTDRRAGLPVFVARDGEAGAGDTDAEIVITGPEVAEAPTVLGGVDYEPEEYDLPEMEPTISVRAPRRSDPYALEIWVEKSAQNDVLEPLARSRNVTFVAGAGELSATHCVWLVQRVRSHRKKTRIFYISDFDPKGADMPVSVARKIEFLLRRDGLDLDVRLDPILLTIAEVVRYQLPRIPIRESDGGRRAFEERYGEGAVELDALEALHPGEMARIINETIDRYRSAARRAAEENERIEAEAQAEAERVRDDVVHSFAPEIEALEGDFEAMRDEIAPHQDALAEIEREATEQIGAIEHEAAESVAGIESVADEAVREIEREAAERIAVIRLMAAGQISPIQSEAAERVDAIKSEADERSAEHVEAIDAAAAAPYQQAAELQGRIVETLTSQAPDADDFE